MICTLGCEPHKSCVDYCILSLSCDEIHVACSFNLNFLFEQCHANFRLLVISECIEKVLYTEIVAKNPQAQLPFITQDIVKKCEDIYVKKPLANDATA